MNTLPVSRIKELVHYDPLTGVFTWLQSPNNRVKAGKPAGRICPKHGYRNINLDYVQFRASRLAWAYMTGEFPEKFVDHVNRNRADDRWANLRLATYRQNVANRPAQKTSKTGVKGVRLEPRTGRYRALIRTPEGRKSLGSFSTVAEAAKAYQDAERANHGVFAYGNGAT